MTSKVRIPKGSLTEYLDTIDSRYGMIFRKAYRILIDPEFYTHYRDDYDLRNKLAKDYEIPTRYAFTMIKEIRGMLKAQVGQKKHLLRNLYQELSKLNKDIEDEERRVKKLKEKARKNVATDEELERLRRKKERLYWLKNKRNKKRQKIEDIKMHLDWEIPFRIGFGRRKRFKKQYHLRANGFKNHDEWYAFYCFYRDHNIASLGSAAENSGNQLSTLIYNSRDGTFSLRLRKLDSKARGKSRYVTAEHLKIPFLQDTIREVVKGKLSKPLFHRFVRSPKGWFLHISFELDCPKTREDGYAGFCGLDYNNGFIELAASDRKGNLIYQEHIDLCYHGTGNAAKTEMGVVCKHIVDLCAEKNWELRAEDLDFETKKARQSKGQSEFEREQNKMVHLLDYHRYKEFLDRNCRKAGIYVDFVEPEYTSINGLKKFGESKKLNRHQAAAYYISRDDFEERETF